MVQTKQTDVVVLGLGPGGEYAANKLASAGVNVIGVDRELVGGECPFFGCTPSKLMIRGADVLAEARRAPELGGQADVRPDWQVVAARIREATNDWSDHSHSDRLEEAGVEIVRGHGRLSGPGTVVVDTEDGPVELTASRGVVLGTGTLPQVPPIDGLADTPYWTNREVVGLTELPRSLVVIGGGPIGCELTQAFARFGVDVTLLEVAERIMGPEEPETSDVIEQVFADEGVTVRTGVDIERVDHDGDLFSVRLAGEESIEAERLLVAVGRSMNLADIGLETVGLDPDGSVVETDQRLRAGEGLWAVGDITGQGAFTHVAMYQARMVVRDLLGEDGPWADYRAVTRVTFTDPEVASVGLSEQQARDAGIRVVTGCADVPSAPRGWIHGAEGGIVKVVADADRGVLVGATVVSPYGGEVLGLLATAVHAEVPVATMLEMHFAYPTFHRTIEVALRKLHNVSDAHV